MSCDLGQATGFTLCDFIKSRGWTEISSTPRFPGPCQAGLLNSLGFCLLLFQYSHKKPFCTVFTKGLPEMLKPRFDRAVTSEGLNLSFFPSFPTVPDFFFPYSRGGLRRWREISRESEVMDKAGCAIMKTGVWISSTRVPACNPSAGKVET